jgi:DeoR/GlpR family transcriptional regulator of sugar metabolism
MINSTLERRNEILKTIMEQTVVKNSDLSERFKVSSETIRKDIDYLEKQGFVRKLHGKAHLIQKIVDTPIEMRSYQRWEEKRRIASEAVKLIHDDSVVYFDGGSTTLEIAKLLTNRSGILVVTNCLSIVEIVAKQKNSVYMLSGFVNPTTLQCNGPGTIESLNNFRPAIAFMGTNGLIYHDGPTTTDFSDVELKKSIINVSAKTCVVCDSSKFTVGAVTQYALWSSIDYVILDKDAPLDIQKKFTPNVEVKIAFKEQAAEQGNGGSL